MTEESFVDSDGIMYISSGGEADSTTANFDGKIFVLNGGFAKNTTLKEKGYLNYEPYGNITLTSLGENTVYIKKYRHNTITNFLNKVLYSSRLGK